jgi:hypothetical protein
MPVRLSLHLCFLDGSGESFTTPPCVVRGKRSVGEIRARALEALAVARSEVRVYDAEGTPCEDTDTLEALTTCPVPAALADIIDPYLRRSLTSELLLCVTVAGRARCQACGSTERCQWCRGCLRTRYCSSTCRRLDWPLHRHVCGRPFLPPLNDI